MPMIPPHIACSPASISASLAVTGKGRGGGGETKARPVTIYHSDNNISSATNRFNNIFQKNLSRESNSKLVFVFVRAYHH